MTSSIVTQQMTYNTDKRLAEKSKQEDNGVIESGKVVSSGATKIKFLKKIPVTSMRQSSKYCAVHKSQFIPFFFWGFAVERLGDSSYPKFFISETELFTFFKVSSFEELLKELSREQSRYLISVWGRAADTKNLQTLFYFEDKNWVFGLSRTKIEFWSILST